MALTFIAQLLGSIPVTNQMGFILVFSAHLRAFSCSVMPSRQRGPESLCGRGSG